VDDLWVVFGISYRHMDSVPQIENHVTEAKGFWVVHISEILYFKVDLR